MDDLHTLSLEDLYKWLGRTGLITRLLELARDEDLGADWEFGDVTSRALTFGTDRAKGLLVARRTGVIAGLAAVPEILHLFKADVDLVPAKGIHDGTRVEAGTVIGTLVGNHRAMLGAERTVLNILGRLSGVATRTSEFVALIAGTKADLFDTRKTNPGMRVLEKYAVRCGGGRSHRLGLYDAALIKDNHIAGVAVEQLGVVVARAVKRAREEALREGLRFIELEVETIEQFKALLDAEAFRPGGVDICLLDNMPPDQLAEAVRLRDEAKARVKLEASGGISKENVAAVAATGVDRISLGTLTHGATWLDIALDIEGPVRI